jgi:hypothetical protein
MTLGADAAAAWALAAATLSAKTAEAATRPLSLANLAANRFD